MNSEEHAAMATGMTNLANKINEFVAFTKTLKDADVIAGAEKTADIAHRTLQVAGNDEDESIDVPDHLERMGRAEKILTDFMEENKGK